MNTLLAYVLILLSLFIGVWIGNKEVTMMAKIERERTLNEWAIERGYHKHGEHLRHNKRGKVIK